MVEVGPHRGRQRPVGSSASRRCAPARAARRGGRCRAAVAAAAGRAPPGPPTTPRACCASGDDGARRAPRSPPPGCSSGALMPRSRSRRRHLLGLHLGRRAHAAAPLGRVRPRCGRRHPHPSRTVAVLSSTRAATASPRPAAAGRRRRAAPPGGRARPARRSVPLVRTPRSTTTPCAEQHAQPRARATRRRTRRCSSSPSRSASAAARSPSTPADGCSVEQRRQGVAGSMHVVEFVGREDLFGAFDDDASSTSRRRPPHRHAHPLRHPDGRQGGTTPGAVQPRHCASTWPTAARPASRSQHGAGRGPVLVAEVPAGVEHPDERVVDHDRQALQLVGQRVDHRLDAVVGHPADWLTDGARCR